jgi:hypothetical protein
MSTDSHTPGPWRWEFNRQHKAVHLVGGRPRFDLTVMDCVRWGMGSAAPRFRESTLPDLQDMHRLPDRPDWLDYEPGRAHHASWHLLVTHPDARLIEAAPELLEALRMAQTIIGRDPEHKDAAESIAAAIAKATGGKA